MGDERKALRGGERRQVSSGDYRGPERRRQPGDWAFEKAVTEAAAQAAQRVAAIHRVRLVTQSAIAALVVSALVALMAAVVVRNAAENLSRSEARYNCTLVTALTGTLGNFVESDARIRAAQAKTAVTVRLLKDLQRVIPERDLLALSRQSASYSSQTAGYWQSKLVPQLDGLAKTNCAAHLP